MTTVTREVSQPSRDYSPAPSVASVRLQIAAGVARRSAERYLEALSEREEFAGQVEGDDAEQQRWHAIQDARVADAERELVRAIVALTVPGPRGEIRRAEDRYWTPKAFISGGTLFVAYPLPEFRERGMPEGEDGDAQVMHVAALPLAGAVDLDAIPGSAIPERPADPGQLPASAVDPAESRARARPRGGLRRRPFRITEGDGLVWVVPSEGGATLDEVLTAEVEEYWSGLGDGAAVPEPVSAEYARSTPDRVVWQADESGSDRVVAVIKSRDAGPEVRKL